MQTVIRPALVLLFVFTIITGLIYPISLTGLGTQWFPASVTGSLLYRDKQPIGSTLIGQAFHRADYFWGRPSATFPTPYNASASAASNFAPSNPALVEAVKARIAALKAVDPNNTMPIPIDLVTASASGLDPHISLAAAQYQLSRVAKARQLPVEQVQALIERYTELPFLGILGEAQINVLALNLALDAEKKQLIQ
ncbi:K+-transporting ATPase, C subunit [Beggiatoa alba B18LD]|uniref:Potassium-transporting ATPase KdpC subunit n=1 Tax=Beggiatoa alba B18LD TaxID=395493 RepID=I3CE78_9GAMM|nr:potassium-transporting ATPase subunit KdpC [Beggiatoa alba]EIJ41921.1 K+-transporting ATPase, C subunit [Beggiatoa alba B18LD]